MESAYVQMVEVVKAWDPFRYGPDFYETEASDVVQVVSEFDDVDYIASKIQHIYFMSFEETLEMNNCKKMANELLLLKNRGSCDI